ncbi:zf-HC2 domain-containing protein [Nocardioides sp. YIM 152315]|uniref:anti-sigma factor family protein n=1 Tax=Nocardioides sp. YIM 152315 TaxID=3031760 RepID=UPI0023DAC832|nr:zf-HC2 domain-containing protein [Nocardioides sp. YIM 152315]MDF1605234.1 zf-HC2 domain-containing protein [Nocardioides sp. YIM 152315]
MSPPMDLGCEFAHDDAAYVLGALPPSERLAFERHLATCPDCARSVGQIAGLPGLLSRVPLDVVESAPAPEPLPDTLLPALLDEVRRGERRRRRLIGLAAAAAVAAVAAVSLALLGALGDRDDGAPRAEPSSAVSTAPAEEMTPIGDGGDVASVALTPVAWGTRLDLECRWAGGEGERPDYQPEGGGSYALVVRSVDGDVQQVATWRAVPGRTMRVTGATSLDRDDIAAVEVQTEDGRPAFELAG